MQTSRSLLYTSLGIFLLALSATIAADENHRRISWRTVQLETEFYSEGATAGDLDHDGHTDIIYGPFWFAGPDFKQRHRYYDGNVFDPHGYSDNFFTFTDDLNRDGHLDVLMIGFPGQAAYWFENPGKDITAATNWQRHLVLDIVDNESPQYVDLNQDGQRDLICSREGFFGFASVDLEQPTKPWTFHPVSDKSAGGRFTHGLGVGDVDGDGKLDLLEKSGWWKQPTQQSDGSIWQKQAVEFSGPGGSHMFAFDIDGDQDHDVVSALAAHGQGVAWYAQLRQGERTQFERRLFVGPKPADTEYGVVFTQPHAIAMGDINGDGLPDLVTGKRPWAHGPHGDAEPNAEPSLYWFELSRERSAVGGAEFVPHMISNVGGVGVDVQIHDVNGDQLADIVVGSKRGAFVHLQQRTELSSEQAAREKPVAKRDAAIARPTSEFPQSGLAPEQAAAQMTLPRGFTADLIAGEPNLHQPVAFCFDTRGRIWVAEAHTYPKRAPEGEGRDRIIILEDRDLDGTYETQKLFAEKLNLISGLEVGHGGVWVGAAPYLLFLPDRNQDDRPDGAPEVVLDGWGYQDTHETLNSFQWGPDGWLYGCHGVFTHSNVGPPGSPDVHRTRLNAGVWRYHPSTQQFEVFAEGTSNPWGVDFDAAGQAVITACVIPHAYHMIQGARYQRQAGTHFNPYTFEDIKTIADHAHYAGNIGDHAWWGRDTPVEHDGTSLAGGGHAHCGAMIYQGDNWPQSYRGKLFMANIHGNRLNQDVLRRDGSGFIASHGSDFLFANDPWFRGIAIKVGPDGAAYLIDWYDKNACHRNTPEIWDRTNGRMYRIRYGKLSHTQLQLNQLPAATLAALHTHENQWVVRMARRALQERAAGVITGLANDDLNLVRAGLWQEVLEQPDNLASLEALWMCHAIKPVADDEALALLSLNHENIRAWGIQLACEDREVSPELQSRLAELAGSERSLRVRLYLASALQRLDVADRWPLAEKLIAHGDSQFDQNIPLLIWYGLEPLVPLDASRALKLAAQSQIPLIRQFIYRRAAVDPQLVGTLVTALADSERPEVQILMLNELRGGAEKIGRIEMPKRWPDVVARFAKHEKPEVQQAVQFLSITYGDQSVFPMLRDLVKNRESKMELRQQALASLEQGKDPQLGALAIGLLDDSEFRGEALRTLSLVDEPSAAQAILERWTQWQGDLKGRAIGALLSRPSYATALLKAIQEKKVPRSELTAVHVGKIQQLNDPELLQRLQEVWGTVRSTPEETKRLIAEIKTKHRPAVLNQADRSEGRLLFNKTCGTCHRIFGEGSDVGPDLTGANRASLDYLLENILDPNAVVGKDYQTVTIVTEDGRVVSGLVREQSDAAVVIHDAQRLVTIPRSEIEEIKPSEKSLMPEGLLKPLEPGQVTNLLAYLQSPNQVTLPGQVPAWDPQTQQVPGAIELENSKHIARGGSVSAQGMSGFKDGRWSGNSQLWWIDGQEGSELEIELDVTRDGAQEVFVAMTKAIDYGIVRFAIDGATVSGPIDLYQSQGVSATGPISLGVHTLTAGKHRLVVTITGQNAKAVPRRMVGLDYIYLAPK